MSPNHIIVWATVIALVVVLALTGTQVLQAVRELKRTAARIDGYADLPVVKALERAERDVARLEAAPAQLGPFVARAQAALAVIRRGPVPADVIAGVRLVHAEIGAFRTLGRR